MVATVLSVANATKRFGGLVAVNNLSFEVYQNEVMVFTDGCPNVEPPRGHIPAMQRFIQSAEIWQSSYNYRVNTFGFHEIRSLAKALSSRTARGAGTLLPARACIKPVRG